MKHKSTAILLIVCIVLAAALLLSVFGLIRAKAEIAELEDRINTQSDYILSLEHQLDAQVILFDEELEIDDYGTLELDGWSVKDGELLVSGRVYIGMFSDTFASASLELRSGDLVLQSSSLIPEVGEAEDVYECGFVDMRFDISALVEGEALQLWLVAESGSGICFSTLGASWYPEGDRLMLIAG